jgi:hypothetical protein
MLALVVALTVQISTGLPNLAGTWTLDAALSDPPQQVARELREDTGGAAADQLFGFGGGQGAGHGQGRGRRGGQAPRTSKPEPLADADRKLLDKLTEMVQFPPTTLTISQSNNDVTIAGEALHADGRSDTRQVEGGSVERTTTWEGPLLVVREKVGHAGTLRTTYSIVTATRQLLVRVNFERDGQLGPFEIRLVYDPAKTSD